MKIENNIFYLPENLTKENVSTFYEQILKLPSAEIKKIDLKNLQKIDSSGIAFIDEICVHFHLNTEDFLNTNIEFKNKYETFSTLKFESVLPPKKINFFEKIGGDTIEKAKSFWEGLYLTADIFYYSILGLFDKKGRRKGSIVQQALSIGVDALPIVSLLSFIIGLILALQSAAQLRQFGANIFVADLIAISMVREMGPMMTAIIIAGRSGSAIASEIATMKVTEEIDALKMMAINPLKFIVVPKLYAISICMPLLVVMSIVIGIFGGLVIGMTYLDLSATSFFQEAFSILELKDLIVSLSKSLFFAWVIAIIGSFYGFQVQGGAEGVGKATTYSVVASIFSIIIFDAIFSLAFLAG